MVTGKGGDGGGRDVGRVSYATLFARCSGRDKGISDRIRVPVRLAPRSNRVDKSTEVWKFIVLL